MKSQSVHELRCISGRTCVADDAVGQLGCQVRRSQASVQHDASNEVSCTTALSALVCKAVHPTSCGGRLHVAAQVWLLLSAN